MALLVGAACALVGWSAWRLRDTSESFYQLKDDYAALALGHGINLDHWKEGFGRSRTVGYFQIVHPGIPLQVVSGLLYQVAHEPGATAAQRALRTLASPERFHRADRIAAIVIFLLTSVAVVAATWPGWGLVGAIVPIAVLAYRPAWPYLFDLVGNETFALPLFLGLWLAMNRALAPALRRWPFFLAGAVCGIGYLNKLNYAAWTVGAVLGLAWYVARVRAPIRTKVVALEALLLGWVLAVVGLGTAILGTNGFERVLAEHRKVFVNTGHYGLGSPGVIDLGVALGSLQDLVGRDVPFTAWVFTVAAIVAWAVVRRWRSGDLSLDTQAMALFLSVSTAVALAAALKHYAPRYLVPAIVPLPFAVLSLGRRLPAFALGTLLLGTMALDVRVALSEKAAMEAARDVLRTYSMELEAARALPVEPGKLKVWTYKVRAAEYGISFVTDNASHRELDEPAYRAGFPTDRGFFRDIPVGLPWEYVVYDRETFPTLDQVPEDVRAASEVGFEGAHLFVLRRKDPPSAPHSPR